MDRDRGGDMELMMQHVMGATEQGLHVLLNIRYMYLYYIYSTWQGFI